MPYPSGRRLPTPVRHQALAFLLTISLLLLTVPHRFNPIIQSVEAASANIVISQVYGGGGSGSGSPAYKNDYVELFNRSLAPVTLTNYSLQYGSATGQFGSSASNIYAITNGTTIPAGKYLLVKLGAAGTLGADFTADQTSTGLSMSASSGKIALANVTAALGCGATATPCALPDSRIVDVVAYGAANNGEGGTTVNNGAALDSTKGAIRKSGGCIETDNNNADFTVATTATGLVPRTSDAAANVCGGVSNNPPTITPPANPIATKTTDAPPFNVSLNGNDDGAVYNWSGTPGTGVSAVSVTAGQGTANATYNVMLQGGFSGTATFTASLSDNVNAPATQQQVNIQVNAAPPPVDHIVISQVYGGGGNPGATYQNDYVELFNPTAVAFDLAGWTVQYASATGTSWQTQPLGGVIQPGEYYLIKLASGGTVGAPVPAANIDGEINMSGAAGKVALSNSGDPLSGCPTGAPALVDLVGYGTANCREGSTNAPAPSNTLAVFRENSGFTDTNVNGSDFVTGTPNPRRTTPIQEIGPAVLSTDPRPNGTNAPRDASITVTFTEAVNVEAGWFNINCDKTGQHNDATVAGGPKFRIITPNTNFLAGEQCMVTILKNFVHDQDLDDSAPNTDTPAANHTFTFTVATGAAPAYGPEVHLTMGNPTDATADTLTPNNYLMEKPEYALSYNRDRGTPNWVSWHLADEWIGSLARNDTFRPDPAVPSDWYRVLHTDYFNSGFDRGHMVPNADRDPETSIPINQATFLMSNIVPQSPDNNQGPWAAQENYLRTLLPANELYIVAGGAGTGGTGSNGFAATIADGHVTVPAQTWKVALVLPKGEDDVSRVTCETRTIAVIMPNVQGIRNDNWENYIVTVDEVEALTGYDFFSNLPDPVERCVEAGRNGVNPALDTDEDGVADSADNCAFVANPDQTDSDGDAMGDVCDPDDDNDGVLDGADLCSNTPPNTQVNAAGCPDADSDGVADTGDNCPFVSNSDQTDTDGDGIGNTCDLDDDGDSVLDGMDNCPLTANPDQADFDRDGIGDTCDLVTGPPVAKEQCKGRGWERFNNPEFRNQGQCVSYVNGRRP